MSDTDVCRTCHKRLTLERTIYATNNGLCRDCYEDEIRRKCRTEEPKPRDRMVSAPSSFRRPKTKTEWLRWVQECQDEFD